MEQTDTAPEGSDCRKVIRAAVLVPEFDTRQAVTRMLKQMSARIDVAVCATVEGASLRLKRAPLDLVVMDPACLDDIILDGTSILDNRAITTIFYSSIPREKVILALARRSVVGFVAQKDGLDSLQQEVRRVIPDLWRPAAQNGKRALNLSPRELQTLREIGLGFTGKEIAARLGISQKSVETYKARACSKLGLRSRSEVVRYTVLGTGGPFSAH